MTLIVGILAKDGAVIAADRAVTFAADDRITVVDSHRKLTVISGGVIIAGTGQVGLGQRFRDIVRQRWEKKEFGRPKTVVEIGEGLSGTAVKAFATTGVHAGMPPKGIGFGALVAYAVEKPNLIEFALRDFQPEHKTEECWYASMGSGQVLADPYLALMRRSVWQDGQPNVEDATFAAYWVMRQAIDAAPGFIAEPIDIAVIRKWNGKDYEAKLLDESQVEQHKDRANDANRQLSQALLGQLPAQPVAPLMPEPELH